MTTEKAPRKREWTIEHVVEDQVIDGVAWPFQKIRVAFRGYVWVLPDTAAGRADALERIRAIRERDEIVASLGSIQRRLAALADRVAAVPSAALADSPGLPRAQDTIADAIRLLDGARAWVGQTGTGVAGS